MQKTTTTPHGRPSAHDLSPPSHAQETPPLTSSCSTRRRQEATVRGVRWALLCTGTGVGERDAEVASAASVHFPTPLHAPELAHGLYVPATSPCYGISSASGDSSPVGAPRPAGGTGVGNFVQPPATISTGLDHLYCLQPASARRRAPRGPGRGGLGEYWVCYTAVIIWTQLGPVAGNERDSSRKIPDARLHTPLNTETETEI